MMPTRNPSRRLAALAVLAVAALASAAFAQQDTWAGVERVIAVGDVHGDCDQLVKTLRAAEVIDDKENWIAGKAHLVQLGDVLDRAPDSRRAMDLLMKLEAQAAKAGGAVHALIGNHEAMVLLDDWRYVHPGEVKALGGEAEFRKAMSPQGTYGKWICSHNAVVKINDLLFVHAGIVGACARMSLAEINKAIRQDLLTGNSKGLAEGRDSPLWDRSLALGDEDEVAPQLDILLAKYGVKHLVVGHTVSTEGAILAKAGGRLIRVDVGMSGYYGGPAACLVVEKGVFYEVAHPKSKRKLDLAPKAAEAPAAPSR